MSTITALVIVELRASVQLLYHVNVSNDIAEYSKDAHLEILKPNLSKENDFSEGDGGGLVHSQPL